ncbi:carbonic anhydrase [Labilithrix luteola]|uniref:carbonic anhydrase n=1 Tax=Labilithrix luteola TaxID=1391654 RepID=UPI0014756770|nr:carbonic anhydrase [Labilithrix luteola]
MKRLIEGLRRYERTQRSQYSERFARLAGGQSPLALFVTCADSRVVPNLIASAEPGDLFTLRNIANLVPRYDGGSDDSVAAAVVYAVEVLGISDIVVCGHSGCGGMQALLRDPPDDKHLRQWLEHGKPALEHWRASQALDSSLPIHDQLSQASALYQLGNLATYPSVRSRLERGEIDLHAWWFDIASASLLAYSEQHGHYVPAITEEEHRPLPTPFLPAAANAASRPPKAPSPAAR